MKKSGLILLVGLFFVFSNFLYAQKLDEKWITKFEKSNYKATESYAETMDYFLQLAEASPNAELIDFGVSPQGRKLKCLIVSKGKDLLPKGIKERTKPVIFIENGIHSGEIEGKDASMLLLRDILVTKKLEHLVDNVVLMVIPIFNVDGHERSGPYNRINQNGPEEMGWRTTAQNLNLNRDFLKADAPEMKALLKLYNSWLPDIFIDVHTTNGADYQYTITYIMDNHQNVPPETRDWITNKFLPVVTKETDKSGYLVTPYVNVFRHDIEEGNYEFLAIPRFSNGYATVQNRPGIVFETHMLKPYKDRVFGTKAMLTSIIKLFNENPDKILKMNRDADEYIIEHYAKENNAYPLTLELTDKADTVNFKGFKHTYYESNISGSKIIKYSGEKYDVRIPYFDHTKVKDSVYVPEEYLIPQEWKEIVDIMKLHGIKVETLGHPQKYRVEKYKFKNVSFPKWPYESRFLPKYDYDVIEKTVKVPEGTYVVKTSQRTLPVILHLLEPLGPDSFVKWGFFNAIFEQKEYFSDYSMEPIAAKMMKENPRLKEEFEQKLKTDEKFRKNSRARLDFFYQHSPYSDEELNMYPVMKVVREND